MSAGRYSLGGVDLPADAIVTSGDGEVLQRSLIRAVDADTWEMQGDGKAVPQEMVLTMTVEGTSENSASAQVALIWNLARNATRIDREGRAYRLLLGARSIAVQHAPGDGWQQSVTLTFLPKEAFWRTTDNGNRLF